MEPMLFQRAPSPSCIICVLLRITIWHLCFFDILLRFNLLFFETSIFLSSQDDIFGECAGMSSCVSPFPCSFSSCSCSALACLVSEQMSSSLARATSSWACNNVFCYLSPSLFFKFNFFILLLRLSSENGCSNQPRQHLPEHVMAIKVVCLHLPVLLLHLLSEVELVLFYTKLVLAQPESKNIFWSLKRLFHLLSSIFSFVSAFSW